VNGSPIRPSPEEEGRFRSIFESAADGLIIADLETEIVVEANPAALAMHGYAREDFIGLHPSAFIHPKSLPDFANSVRAIRSGAAIHTQVLHVRRDGSTFHGEWRGTAFTYLGQLCLLGMVRDVSRRIQAEQRLRLHVAARTREQSALLKTFHTLASTLELQPGLILEQLRGIIEYAQAALFSLTDLTLTALAVRVSPGLSMGRGPQQLEQAAPFQVRLVGPEALAGLFNSHRPIRIADVTSADPAAESLRALLNGEAAVLLVGVRSWMWVPLAVKGRIIGFLGVAHARQNHFTAHHAALALSIADQVALAMVNAELYEHGRELAALEERQRLARNLHDAVNQSSSPPA